MSSGRVEVSYAGLRADLAALDQIEHERAQVSERVRSELLRAGFDDLDLEDSLQRYDTAASGHALLVDAAATRRQKTAELERLLGEESLDEARRRLREIETTLNGHAALAEGRDLAAVEAERAAAEAERDRAAVSAAALEARLAERQQAAPGLRSSASSSRRRPSASPTSSTSTPCSGSPRPSWPAAADETYRDVAPLLGAALAEPIGRLTGGRYATAFVKDDLGVRLETPERGEVVDLAALSHGTQRQAYLVQRLELVRLLCPEGATPPILLDDPFAHFDAERVERTLAYLADLAADQTADRVRDGPCRGRPRAGLRRRDRARPRGRRRRLGAGDAPPAGEPGGRSEQPLDVQGRQAEHAARRWRARSRCSACATRGGTCG